IAASASAQTFPITLQKLSGPDDSVGDMTVGRPPIRPCATPCTDVHYVIRIINCASSDVDGTCTGPNALPVTGGSFVDTPPLSLPLDCSRGVTVTGAGSWDPPTCDTASNTVRLDRVMVAPGGT